MKCKIPYRTEDILALTEKGGAPMMKMINEVTKVLYDSPIFYNTIKKHVFQNKGNAADAKDLIQETMIQLSVSLVQNKFQGNSNLENYAFGIFKFKLKKWCEKRGRIPTVPSGYEPVFLDEPTTSDPESELIDREAFDSLEAIFNQLPDRYKEVLILKMEKFSHSEISKKLGITTGSSKNLLVKARNKLRELLGSPDPDSELSPVRAC